MERVRRTIRCLARQQGINVKRLRRGQRVMPVPLLSATLRMADVVLAARALANRRTRFLGGELRQLSRVVKDRFGVTHAGFYMGGRASLCAVVRALGLTPGDEVLIPAFTCQCVVNALRYEGMEPVYVDIELDTYAMDASLVSRAVTGKTRAMLIQHTFGMPGRDLDALLALARKHGLYVIEDCAHATGGTWRGKLLGTLGDIGFFSSERSKVINTIHGGFVVTNNPVIGRRLEKDAARLAPAPDDFTRRVLWTLIHSYFTHSCPLRFVTSGLVQGLLADRLVPQMHEEELAGAPCSQYHWSLPDAVAPLMVQQLSRVDRQLEERRRAAKKWAVWCVRNGLEPPKPSPDANPTWLRYPVRVDPAIKKNFSYLEQRLGATVGVWFQSAAHPLPMALQECPKGMEAAATCINLPTLDPNRA
ncbi:DegT/DnrJ/EryC1/StrS family aminotransferase [Desulfoluna spongiiphila]|uniref:dTDP-4-amino-4,6-dideoxygalactose transaminase n=1 Tax=Desulfoluna spongiiphila TaxID=419481 RepID=A0A1G5BHQ0_9BACT|nr:aminotransferase class I/II-fold pyridoxal phosphate-dependent enzyme [Desulfoluna spongiiphila]SCX89490.1 dTDP-4-amino-4,6-dideoxygalactose transaminase [Desulfoluna spongiiphila]